ncbi:accessory gene regulator ArgB-like protein [Desulfosporosinus youngiae]|uniref:Protein possibly involved in post-translational modification of quorum-sensing peptides n=1 Tax=Desulfosporosinus youngiae DSM 17734 TaxID=768710 RepID=H5XWY1_9FIRM|nr:accessory gene regulator B family protein [Desulfosporosinus youngiae]EHQ90849.1 protein possibly involved in post-translational modification of quorum-sensing peptides [Desulfosporosinus youngiae DSM 17734]
MKFAVISEKLAKGLTEELDFIGDEKEIISYAIYTTLLSIIGTIMVVCLAYFLNVLKPTVIAVLFGGTLRRLSGGAHFNTPLKCLLFGTIAYCTIGISAKLLFIYELLNQTSLLTVTGIAFLLVLILAPVDSPAKPINSKKLQIVLKISSLGFIIISLLLIRLTNDPLIIVSAVLGLLYQSITLLPIFNRKEVKKSI